MAQSASPLSSRETTTAPGLASGVRLSRCSSLPSRLRPQVWARQRARGLVVSRDAAEADKGDADKGDADKGDADKGDADKGDADKGDADKGGGKPRPYPTSGDGE